jgi:hypothetical protein
MFLYWSINLAIPSLINPARFLFSTGTNIVVKAPPYRPDTSGAFDAAHSLNDADDLALLQSMGYTTIRLSGMLVRWANHDTYQVALPRNMW